MLYNESHPEEQAIGAAITSDIRKIDVVIFVDTSLQVKGVKDMIRDLCLAAKKQKTV
jgi:NAD-dependent SIR2 family protein deacetylase